MTSLEETFGEDFVQEYKQEIAKRREERQKLTDEAAYGIANLAINEEKFKEGETPHFKFTTENDVTHDVFLMQLPDMKEGDHIFNYANTLEQSGARTCPLDYMGEWWSCLFNDPEELQEMQPGEHYIVVGEHDIWTDDDGNEHDQVSPVRGVMTLHEAKEMADEYLDGAVNEGGSSGEEDTEEEEDQQEEEEEQEEDGDSSDSGGGLFGGGGDDDEDDGPVVDESEVQEQVDALGDDEPAVWELEAGDDRLEKLVKVICQNLDLSFGDDEIKNKVGQYALDHIESHGEDDDDDEEDALF